MKLCACSTQPNYPKLYSMYSLKHSDLWTLTSNLLYLFLSYGLPSWYGKPGILQEKLQTVSLFRFKKAWCFIRFFLILMKIRCTLSENNAQRAQCSWTCDFCFLSALVEPKAAWQASVHMVSQMETSQICGQQHSFLSVMVVINPPTYFSLALLQTWASPCEAQQSSLESMGILLP